MDLEVRMYPILITCGVHHSSCMGASPRPLLRQAPVPVAIGGAGLPADIKFRDDLPNAGLANITGTYLNLLGFATPAHMEPSLI